MKRVEKGLEATLVFILRRLRGDGRQDRRNACPA